MIQARDGGLYVTAVRESETPPLLLVLLVLQFLTFILTAGGSEIKQEGLVMLQPPFLLLSLRLSLVVQQEIRVVMTTAVGHHHGADGAGVDVLDLEKTFDDVDILRLHILSRGGRTHKIINIR